MARPEAVTDIPTLFAPEDGRRIAVLAPYGNDGRLTSAFLREMGLQTVECRDCADMCRIAAEEWGVCLLAEECLNESSVALMKAWLAAQPSWSELPVVLVTSSGDHHLEHRRLLASWAGAGNVTLLERPFRKSTLVSTIEMALGARLRQYQVCELVEQTRRDAEALREAARRKDEFLAMLAHELRNPLSSISNAAHLLNEDADADERSWAADVVSRQTAQLSRLVDDLLDVSRITRGKIELRRRVFDATPVVASACETVAPLVSARNHTLQTAIQEGGIFLDADPARFEQIVVNLLNNAAKYTPPGGHIWLDVFQEAGEARIRIRDSGIGILPERIPGMFELFAQGDRGAARSEGGLGIGLTVVKGLCELLGGSVEAHSDGPGHGSTFTVRLPATLPPEVKTEAANGTAAGGNGSMRVLIVDDNVDSACGLGRLLKSRGYIVDVTHDGQTAIERARTFGPAAVLLDIGMPGMDGYEVARRLRRDPHCAVSLIVALTGYGQAEDRARAQASGFDVHLIKPVNLEALLSLLQQRLAGAVH